MPDGGARVRRALITVSDKRGVADFARGLARLGVEIISTGGTASVLAEAGIHAVPIERHTGFPEMLDGRLKTLHPRIHGGILAARDRPDHERALEAHGIAPIDLVCVNLYPFERTVARTGVEERDAIEAIDIGGPTLIRAAAKNHAFCACVVRPESYEALLAELDQSGGVISPQTREALAAEAFALTARYDAAISAWFARRDGGFPESLSLSMDKVLDLSYGENPHQRAAYYAEAGAPAHLLSSVAKLHGKPLSLNNLLDLNAGRLLLREFGEPAAAIIKHNNPCGCAVGKTAWDAYEKALAGDPVSAFGGVVCLNREVDAQLGERIAQGFVELLFAPGFSTEALEALTRKRNVRILRDDADERVENLGTDYRRVIGGWLAQDPDTEDHDTQAMSVVTRREPTESEWVDLLFAWQAVKHVRSNAIVLARDAATIGIGAGQMSRVDSVRIAIQKARQPLPDSVMASDAFFPFADGVEEAAASGITAVIQPGGSRRDGEVIAAADEAGLAMVFTHKRHFRH